MRRTKNWKQKPKQGITRQERLNLFEETKIFEATEATIEELQSNLESGKLTSRQLVMLYLERIARLDQAGPKINAILEINPDALFIADALDRERRAKGPRGPLHGIPLLVKDNINTGDKMHTSAGSLALADHYAKADSFAVEKLRQAGAILLGKTNMTEWANLISSKMPAGYSSRGGQVLNPYGPGELFVGGSSSGSSAAVAAGFAAGALGTETASSILSPACQNSLVGIKPTVGLVSRTGVIPTSYTQDTIGTLAKSVTDATLILTAIAGSDLNDPATWNVPLTENGPFDFRTCLKKDGLHGLRIGIPREVYFDELEEEEARLIEAAIDVLKNSGATIIDNIVIPSASEKWDFGVAWLEMKSALNHYLSQRPADTNIRSLQDIIRFNDLHEEKMLTYGQDVFIAIDSQSGTLREPHYLNSLQNNFDQSRTRGLDFALEQHDLDLLFFPGYAGADMAARAGYPSVVVPAGYTSAGKPIGVQFTGTAWSEPVLIRAAYAYEQTTKHRVPPQLESHEQRAIANA